MGGHKDARSKHRQLVSSAKEAHKKKQETIRLVNELLHREPVDVKLLRKYSAVRGLVNHQVRARVWPYLLGVKSHTSDDTVPCERDFSGAHQDAHTIKVDSERSLYAFTSTWTDEARNEKQLVLQRLLNNVVSGQQDVHYYQGLHDIAGVLLLVLGEGVATRAVERLATHHLRDCTRPNLEPIMDTLRLMPVLISRADPEVHDFIQASECPNIFAVVWMLTWHSHDLRDLETAARLFDLFIASHPLMPMYIGVAAMLSSRHKILEVECDLGMVHSAISKLPMLGELDTDMVIRKALELYRLHPPRQLMKVADSCCALCETCTPTPSAVVTVVTAHSGNLLPALCRGLF
ncbi:hypothetical protein CYMTET_37784 [Cymbomonas tetramitiformis]|uniref:Rab-GAP TBC domain-containing protein n=1 Tax=Cymbomonas tetramitiformis TaxID=36881 RepID=A0AAE0CD91_9CHLO|nr:hypothetical protein CYMTET_37784 [Cymbomonas tetramitiformis]